MKYTFSENMKHVVRLRCVQPWVLGVFFVFGSLIRPEDAFAKIEESVPIFVSSPNSTGESKCGDPISRDIPYSDALRVAIERCFVYPPHLDDGARCEIRVSQSPQGIVTRVEIRDCSGHPKFADYAERAVLKASPLPKPVYESSFLPVFGVVFSPNVERLRATLRAAPIFNKEVPITPAPPTDIRNKADVQGGKNQVNNATGVDKPGKVFVLASKAGKYQSYVDACLIKVSNATKFDPNMSLLAQSKVQGRVPAILTVLPNGKLEKFDFFSSGSKVLDDVLARAIQAAAPFKPFPSGMQEVASLTIGTVFTFGPTGAEQDKALVSQACYDSREGKENPRPVYPSLSRTLREEGTTILSVFVSSLGYPELVELNQSSGHENLDQSALDTVKSWCFYPAQKNGVSVDAWLRVPIKFRLEQQATPLNVDP